MSNPTPAPLALELAAVAAERDRLAALLDELTAAVAAVTYRDFGARTDTNEPARRAIHALRGLES